MLELGGSNERVQMSLQIQLKRYQSILALSIFQRMYIYLLRRHPTATNGNILERRSSLEIDMYRLDICVIRKSVFPTVSNLSTRGEYTQVHDQYPIV